MLATLVIAVARRFFFDVHGKMIFQETSFTSEASMIFVAVMLTLVSIFGNGAFLAIFARFQEIRRNFTNILIANLAVVDCLNAVFNVPLFTMYIAVRTNWLEGKNWAIFSSSLQLEFVLLNLVSMAALMLDRFLAVYFGVKYFTWKTTKKAKIAVFLMWMVSTIVVVLCWVPLFSMDIDDVPLREARGMIPFYSKKEKSLQRHLWLFLLLLQPYLESWRLIRFTNRKSRWEILNCISFCERDLKFLPTITVSTLVRGMVVTAYYL